MEKIAIEFDIRTRLLVPKPKESVQSLYIFNMYRAGSSLTEAIARTIAMASNRVGYNVVSALDRNGISIIDPGDYSRESTYLDNNNNSLDRINELSGYLFYGFREIPKEYAVNFPFIAASVLIVRDPRDILYSQYSAVGKHQISGAAGKDIERLREITSEVSREEFVLQDGSINFIKRICNCYRPIIEKGILVIRYEEMFENGSFSSDKLLSIVCRKFSPYLGESVPFEKYQEILSRHIENSKSLKGHATGGTTGMYKNLNGDTAKIITKNLESELKLLGYL